LINLVLLAVVVYQARRLQVQSRIVIASQEPAALRELGSSTGKPSTVSAGTTSAETAPVAEAAFPKWSQVESSDYKTYINNLRILGCPEETIRDIISADVAQTFSKQRAQKIIATRGTNFHYWEAQTLSPEAAAVFAQQKAVVDGEMQATLNDLLGPGAAAVDSGAYWRATENDWKLSFLPTGLRHQVETVETQYQEVNAQFKTLADWKESDKSPTELQTVIASYDQRKAQLEQLMTPEQFKEYDMTTSFTGDNLRRRMADFHPTPEEFETIFDAWRAHDENLGHLRANDQADPGNAHVFAAIHRALGDDRFAQYTASWWKH
jgi:hypothetical protein